MSDVENHTLALLRELREDLQREQSAGITVATHKNYSVWSDASTKFGLTWRLLSRDRGPCWLPKVASRVKEHITVVDRPLKEVCAQERSPQGQALLSPAIYKIVDNFS